jgi:hypothetical protein
VSACGRNDNNHHNPDNFIVAPGVSNGAHHVHDYVGNLSTDGFSTDQSLAAAGTTCKGNDKSAYFWPVLRTRGKTGADVHEPGGSPDGNIGTILRPASVTLEFRGNAKSKVRAMPKFLRVITGDAKAGTNGLTNARAAWTCTGFEDRTTTKYPICPQGSRVERILDFASCWDGKNTDSTNHRSHIVFPKNDGSCWQKTVAVPQLRMVLTYDIPAKSLFSLDTFPEQKHNPLTDHADFTNVMPDSLMRLAVDCLNTGRNCDAAGPIVADPGAGTPSPAPTASQSRVAPPAPPAASRTQTASRSADGQTYTTPPRNQAGRQAQQVAPPAQPAGNQQPVQPVQAPPAGTTGGPAPVGPATDTAVGPNTATAPDAATVPNTATTPGSAPDTGTAVSGDSQSGSQPGSTGNAGNAQDAAPGQADTAQRQLAGPPPLADSPAAEALPGTPAGAPAGAPAINKAALPTAGGDHTLLYVVNGAALAALAGWLGVMVRRRRLR